MNGHFGRTCRLHLQGRKISQAGNQHEAISKKNLLYLYFNPEDDDGIFVRNVGLLLRTTQRYILEDRSLHNHLCENFVLRNWNTSAKFGISPLNIKFYGTPSRGSMSTDGWAGRHGESNRHIFAHFNYECAKNWIGSIVCFVRVIEKNGNKE
jgi:hypothetical protein